jgi:integrase
MAKRRGEDRLAKARASQTKGRLSNASINKHMRHLHALLEYARERRWVDYNAASCKALPTSPRNVVMSIEETQRVIAELEGPPRDERGVLTAPSPNWSLMVRVAIYTGMRQGEILGLQWHDLHATDGALYVSRTWKDGAYSTPKTENGYRWVEVPKELDELRRWQTELRNISVSRRARPGLSDQRGPATRAREHSAARLVSGAETRGHLRLEDEGG